jgi:hypothetical protein
MPAIHHRLRRAPLLAIAVAASVLAAAIAAAPAAHAGISSTTCTGSSAITYQPGLTNTPRTVSYTETDTFAHCISTDPALASGLFTVTVSLPGASCLAIPSLTTNTPYDIAWNNGQASNINLSYTDVVAEGIEQVTGVGTVTSGEFTGAAVTIIWLYTVPDPLLCLTPGGVTGQTGLMTAEITL